MELPIGYRFKPTDEELVFHYLINKACNRPLPAQAVKEITARDLYLKHPKCSDITAPSSSGGTEWYFFVPEEESSYGSHHSGKETSRFVGDGTGFWKLTGEERPIYNLKGQVFALKKNLTYFSGNPSEPRKTHWKMELFRLPVEFYSSQNFKGKVSHRLIAQLLDSLSYRYLTGHKACLVDVMRQFDSTTAKIMHPESEIPEYRLRWYKRD